MITPSQKIRQDALSKTGERARDIMGSQFSANPSLDDQYYLHVSQDSFYLGIYTRWVLSQSPLPPTPEESEFYRMREDILGIKGIADPKTVLLNEPLFMFFIDICMTFIERLMERGLEYYNVSKSDEDAVLAMREAAYKALLTCDYEHVQKEGYPYFLTAFLDLFKVFFATQIGAQPLVASLGDQQFVQEIEKEWLRLHDYSDSLYGFEVMPNISTETMLCYIKLPFANQEFRHLSSEHTHRQMLNYVVALATFKPVPDSRIKAYFRQELCALYLPLAEQIVKSEIRKNGKTISEQDLLKIVMDEISKAARSFDYFYATKMKLVRKKISPLDTALFPLTDNYAAKLGHIFMDDEFPFTSFLERHLGARIRLYLGGELVSSILSLDEEFGDNGTRLDTLSDDTKTTDRSLHIPDYDAFDKDGKVLGWKRDTFAGIIGKSKDTLKRWDKEGLLSPLRYPIYSSSHKQQVKYRAYTRDDIAKAKEVEIIKTKKARHQK